LRKGDAGVILLLEHWMHGAIMVKKLARIGNSLGVIIERPILELLKVDETTPLEVSTDGDVLVIRPLRESHQDRVRAAAKRVAQAQRRTLDKLAK
jgi:antitoxin component of MazEF toxin-antitoxin module